MGYLPDSPTFYDYLRRRELLRFVGGMHGLVGAVLNQEVDDWLESFDLSEEDNEFAVKYSTGMKKKFALGMATIHEPKLLILDEPTATDKKYKALFPHPQYILQTKTPLCRHRKLLTVGSAKKKSRGLQSIRQIIYAPTPKKVKLGACPQATCKQLDNSHSQASSLRHIALSPVLLSGSLSKLCLWFGV